MSESRRTLWLLVLMACNPPPSSPDDAASDASSDAAFDSALVDVGPDVPLDAALPRDAFAELQAMSPLCTPDEWCWAWPSPTGNRYGKVFGTAADNIWLLGGYGTVLQWDGFRWRAHQLHDLPGQEILKRPYSIVGTSGTNVWVVYGSSVQHWNGATWTIVDSGPLTAVPYYLGLWLAPNGDVWGSSPEGLKRSQNGGPFQLVVGASNLTSIWGFASDDFFVTSPNTIHHWDGQSLTQVFNTPFKYPGFYQGTVNDAWASGANNTLVHWDGTTWTQVPTNLPADTVIQKAEWRASNDVTWLTGKSSHDASFLHWDGTSLTSTPIDHASYGEVCCGLLTDITVIADTWWIVGYEGAVYTRIGPDQIKPIIEPVYYGAGIWGTSDTDLYFGGGANFHHWNGTTMSVVPVGTTTAIGIKGIAGAGIGGANELWTISRDRDAMNVSTHKSSHFDGVTWTTSDLFSSPGNVERLSNLYAIGPGRAMVIGNFGRAMYYNNGTWSPVATGVTVDLWGVWGPDADNVWVSGANGTLLRWSSANPGVMTPDPTFPATTNDLGPIHGADGAMWIANLQTSIVSRRTAAGWSSIDANLIVGGVFAVSANNVVATTYGSGRIISRWNGTEFVRENHGYEGPMYSVFQPPGGKMWLSSGHGIVTHP